MEGKRWWTGKKRTLQQQHHHYHHHYVFSSSFFFSFFFFWLVFEGWQIHCGYIFPHWEIRTFLQASFIISFDSGLNQPSVFVSLLVVWHEKMSIAFIFDNSGGCFGLFSFFFLKETIPIFLLDISSPLLYLCFANIKHFRKFQDVRMAHGRRSSTTSLSSNEGGNEAIFFSRLSTWMMKIPNDFFNLQCTFLHLQFLLLMIPQIDRSLGQWKKG